MNLSNEDFFKLMTKMEPLRADLRPYVTKIGELPFLNAPLVQYLGVDVERSAMINKTFDFKVEEVNKARNKGDWGSFVFLHERPYRLYALLEAKDDPKGPNGEEFWKLAGRVWIDSENIWQEIQDWRWIWGRKDQFRSACMTDPDDLEVYKNLPEKIEVWRGTGHSLSIRGISWTLDKEKAIWFAKRFHKPEKGNRYLIRGEVAKKDVCAYFGLRNEQEIVTCKAKVKETIKLQD